MKKKLLIGPRLAGVVVAATLLVFGLALPALAMTPTISSFTPTGGPVGCQVTITGTGFTSPAVTKVTFGADTGSPVDQTTVLVDSSTQVRAAVPTSALTGKLTVTNNVTSAESSGTFTVGGSCVSPTITSFSPLSGPVGTSVTITGTNLTGATSVKFNGTAAIITSNTATQIVTTVPAGATTGPITVTTAGGTATSATNFTVGAASVPTITSFTPTAGPVGTSVTITGTNLTGATSVKFHGTSATITSNTATTIVTTVPASATTGTITVTTAGGTATSATSFTVMAIASFTPISGPVGTTVTITGTGLAGATAVKFNGTTATITSNTATTIVTTVPAAATTGTITVTNATGTATSATSFTVTAPTSHARSISLRLRDALVARGKVTVSDGFAACADSVAVKIQKRVSGHWKTIKTTTTSSLGGYSAHLRNRHGRYRSLAPRVTTGTDTCSRALSLTKRH